MTTTHGGTLRRVFALSYPIAIANLSQILLGLVDTAMISRVSTEALAAAAVASSVNIATSMLFSGWATAAQVITARRFGEGRQVDIGRLLDVSLLVGVGAGLLVLLVLSIGSSLFFAAFGVGEAVRAEGVTYLRVLAFAAPLAAATAMFRAVYAGVGETSVAMRMTFLVNTINIPLNYVLIFVVGWGLLGAGVGTVISVAVGCVYMGQFGWRRFRGTYELFRVGHLRHFQEVLPRLWSIGWPETAMLFLGYINNVLVLRIVAPLGTSGHRRDAGRHECTADPLDGDLGSFDGGVDPCGAQPRHPRRGRGGADRAGRAIADGRRTGDLAGSGTCLAVPDSASADPR